MHCYCLKFGEKDGTTEGLKQCYRSKARDGWGGFDNDATNGIYIGGKVEIQCAFYERNDCSDKPFHTESAATGTVKVPNIGKDSIDKMSSFYCDLSTVSSVHALCRRPSRS